MIGSTRFRGQPLHEDPRHPRPPNAENVDIFFKPPVDPVADYRRRWKRPEDGAPATRLWRTTAEQRSRPEIADPNSRGM
jgi:hypothetical protein